MCESQKIPFFCDTSTPLPQATVGHIEHSSPISDIQLALTLCSEFFKCNTNLYMDPETYKVGSI